MLRWFDHPEEAVDHLAGLRRAQALLDREGFLESLQDRARRFEWDAAMQWRADQWVSQQLVGWSEEVHKGLEGLRRDDVGRPLNARHGCSFRLSRVVQVHRGVLTAGDNDFYAAVETELGPDSEWVRLRRTAFGIEDERGRSPTLREQVVAGLQLYVATVTLVESALQEEDRPVIVHTVHQIRTALV